MKRVVSIVAVFMIVFAFEACANGQTGDQSNSQEQPVKQIDPVVTVEAAAANALKAGSMLPEFSLSDSRNNLVNSTDLLAKSNLVVVFYRGGWCPFCNLYLKKLQDNLDEIKAEGGELVAISAENPDDSLSTAEKDKLKFHVLSDKNLDYARKMGLVYQLPSETDKKYKGMGIDLVVSNDMDKPELPISATYVVNRAGKIVYAFIEPDYKKRAEPETVIGELKKIKEAVQ